MNTIIYDIVSDIQVFADRPLAVILSHSDLRTDEENNAFKEYICQSSEKALGKQVPVFQISSLNYSVNELDEKNDLVRFLEWVRTKVEDRNTFKNKVAIAEKKLVDIWIDKKLIDYRKKLSVGKRVLSPCDNCTANGMVFGDKHSKLW